MSVDGNINVDQLQNWINLLAVNYKGSLVDECSVDAIIVDQLHVYTKNSENTSSSVMAITHERVEELRVNSHFDEFFES